MSCGWNMTFIEYYFIDDMNDIVQSNGLQLEVLFCFVLQRKWYNEDIFNTACYSCCATVDGRRCVKKGIIEWKHDYRGTWWLTTKVMIMVIWWWWQQWWWGDSGDGGVMVELVMSGTSVALLTEFFTRIMNLLKVNIHDH